MDAVVAGLVGALGGVVIGAALNIIADALRSAREDRFRTRDLVRDKLEELCGVADEVISGYVSFRNEVVGHIVRRQPLTEEHERIPWARLSTLVQFYTPRLKPQLETLLEHRNQIGRAVIRLMHANAGDIGDAEKTFTTEVSVLLKGLRSLQEQTASDFERRFGGADA
jgi:hypothetical protein